MDLPALACTSNLHEPHQNKNHSLNVSHLLLSVINFKYICQTLSWKLLGLGHYNDTIQRSSPPSPSGLAQIDRPRFYSVKTAPVNTKKVLNNTGHYMSIEIFGLNIAPPPPFFERNIYHPCLYHIIWKIENKLYILYYFISWLLAVSSIQVPVQ